MRVPEILEISHFSVNYTSYIRKMPVWLRYLNNEQQQMNSSSVIWRNEIHNNIIYKKKPFRLIIQIFFFRILDWEIFQMYLGTLLRLGLSYIWRNIYFHVKILIFLTQQNRYKTWRGGGEEMNSFEHKRN